eukprot:m.195478 g.195478  ORF g.195478 m.195478 type:complete len:652 (-) comp32571_c1_seq1:234-2189(-)
MSSHWAAMRDAIPHEERNSPKKEGSSRPESKFFDVADVVAHAALSGILAHEVNKGAQCLTCGDKCSGLELHFWRKICINCKCSPAAHEQWEGNAPKIGALPGWRMSGVFDGDGKKAPHKSGKRMHKIGKLSNNLIQHLEQEMNHRFGVTNQPPKPLNGRSFKYQQPNSAYELASPGVFGEKAHEAQAHNAIPVEIAFAWEPTGISEDQVVEFFNNVPMFQVPVVGTKGEQEYRIRANSQMPAHDFNSDLCHALSSNEKEEFTALVDLKSRKHHTGKVVTFEETSPCQHCHEDLPQDTLGVQIMVTKQGFAYHPKCFVCTVCDDLLVNLKAFVTGEKLYCGRHFNDQFKARCAACDESIMETKYVKAEGRAWHSKHFCCSVCDTNLAGKRYVPIDSFPHCVDCYYKATGTEPETEKKKTETAPAVAAPDEEIYLTVKFGGSKINSDPSKTAANQMKQNASIKIKKAAQQVPSDAPPPPRRSDASIKKKSGQASSTTWTNMPPRPKPNTAAADVVIRKQHEPDVELYEEMWQGGLHAPLKVADAVEPQFAPRLGNRTAAAPQELPPRRTSGVTAERPVAPNDTNGETPPRRPQPFASTRSPKTTPGSIAEGTDEGNDEPPQQPPRRMPQAFSTHSTSTTPTSSMKKKMPQPFT